MDPNRQSQMDPNRQSQFMQQPQPYYQQQPQAVPYNKGWHVTKIVFLSLSILFSIIIFGISAALAVDRRSRSYQIVWVGPQAGVAFCWAVAELITICARGGKRGIHPGAHVALHLLLWLGWAAAVGLEAYMVVYSLECDYYCRRYGSLRYSDYFLSSTQALLALSSMMLIIHFTLFVRACVETSQRNRMAGPVLMVPQPMYYQQPMQYAVPQAGPPSQHGYPVPPQQAHLSGYYGQPQEVQKHITGSSVGHPSQPSATPIQEDGLHPVPNQPHTHQ